MAAYATELNIFLDLREKSKKKKNKVFKKHGLITSCVVKEKVVSLKLLPLENAFVLPQ